MGATFGLLRQEGAYRTGHAAAVGLRSKVTERRTAINGGGSVGK
jgi:hypothetical protein